MANKSAGKFFFQALLLLVLLFSLVRLVIVKNGAIVVFEFLMLALLLLLSVVGLATYRKSGRKLLLVVFLLYAANILLLWYLYKSLYLTLLLVSLVGLWLNIPLKRKEVVELKSSAPPQKVVDGRVEVKVEPKAESKEKAALIKTKFTPGKYVASKRSNVYHEPKCDWAKKIQKDRRLWFASREEALNKGYKKHDCVQ